MAATETITARKPSKEKAPPGRADTIEGAIHRAVAGAEDRTQARAAADGEILKLELELLDDNPSQKFHRQGLDEDRLEELCASLRDHGLLQSITVRRVGARFQIIAGHRRVAAFRRLHSAATTQDEKRRFAAIPAQEKLAVSDEQMMLYGIVENLQRDDPSPVEAASSLAQYQSSQQLSVQALAARTGLDYSRVKRLLRLDAAPAVVKQSVVEGILVSRRAEGPDASEGRAKRSERRRLDLMAALEFVRLHEHLVEESPKKAEARTESAIRRALEESWGFRRIQAFCQAAIAGKPARGAKRGSKETPLEAPPAKATAVDEALEVADDRIIVHCRKFARLSAEDAARAKRLLDTLLADLH